MAAQSIAALYGGTVSAEWGDFTAPLLNDLDEDALPMGAALYAGYALGWLRGVFD